MWASTPRMKIMEENTPFDIRAHLSKEIITLPLRFISLSKLM